MKGFWINFLMAIGFIVVFASMIFIMLMPDDILLWGLTH